MKRYVLLLFVFLLLSGCMKDDELNLPFNSFAPRDIGDGHVLSYPSAENIDSIALLNIYREVNDDDNLWSIRSLLVFRHGLLVSEHYFKDENDINTRHLIWSATKQVLGVLSGIAIEDGLIGSLDDPISDYLKDELYGHPDKANITIKNLILMQSGISYNNSGLGGETDQLLRQIPDRIVDFILSLDMDAQPGTVFYYNDGNPHLISAIIQKMAGKPTDQWAEEVLFSEIGFKNYNWVRYRDGTTHGAYGIETTPRELAKIAMCVADSGYWKGKQLVSKDWIKEMTTPHITETPMGYAFGYQWWKDISHNISFMDGHGGQFAFIIPSKDLLVVITSFPNTQDDYQITPSEALPYVYRIMGTAH